MTANTLTVTVTKEEADLIASALTAYYHQKVDKASEVEARQATDGRQAAVRATIIERLYATAWEAIQLSGRFDSLT